MKKLSLEEIKNHPAKKTKGKSPQREIVNKETVPRNLPEAKKRIPDFVSIEDEAKFWDTHDTTDYEDEFKSIRPTKIEARVEPSKQK